MDSRWVNKTIAWSRMELMDFAVSQSIMGAQEREAEGINCVLLLGNQLRIPCFLSPACMVILKPRTNLLHSLVT